MYRIAHNSASMFVGCIRKLTRNIAYAFGHMCHSVCVCSVCVPAIGETETLFNTENPTLGKNYKYFIYQDMCTQ